MTHAAVDTQKAKHTHLAGRYLDLDKQQQKETKSNTPIKTNPKLKLSHSTRLRSGVKTHGIDAITNTDAFLAQLGTQRKGNETWLIF